MKKYISFIIITCLIMFESCQKSFLDQEYKNGLVDVTFFKTPAHATAALTGVYDVLGFEGQTILGRKALGSSAADDIVELSGDYGRVGAGLIELDTYKWTTSNMYILEHWYSCYKGIERANEVIKYVPKIPGMDATLTTRYLAEAKTLRALFYYNLVTAYGDVPLLLEPITLDQSKLLTRNPQKDIWDQIIKDLTEASTVLPASYATVDFGRVTKGFAYGMLSTVYLWTKEYDKSIAAANNVTGYSLWPVYGDIFNGVKESSSESILEVMNASGSPTEGVWMEETSEVNRSLCWGPFFSYSLYMEPSRELIDHQFETGDLRKKQIIIDYSAGDTYDANGDGKIDSKDNFPDPPVNARYLKYVKKGANLAVGALQGVNQDVNVMVMRYAEILLNLAEAYNESGQSAKALAPLNLVRARAGLLPIATTVQSDLRTIILHERLVEFCFEGFRFFDLKRAGKLAEVLGPLGFTAGKNEVFPIPQSEVDMTKMEQNPLY